MAIQEVITELKQPAQSKSQPKNIVEKKSFTKNSILNDVFLDDQFNKTKLVDEINTYQSLKEKKNV